MLQLKSTFLINSNYIRIENSYTGLLVVIYSLDCMKISHLAFQQADAVPAIVLTDAVLVVVQNK